MTGSPFGRNARAFHFPSHFFLSSVFVIFAPAVSVVFVRFFSGEIKTNRKMGEKVCSSVPIARNRMCRKGGLKQPGGGVLPRNGFHDRIPPYHCCSILVYTATHFLGSRYQLPLFHEDLPDASEGVDPLGTREFSRVFENFFSLTVGHAATAVVRSGRAFFPLLLCLIYRDVECLHTCFLSTMLLKCCYRKRVKGVMQWQRIRLCLEYFFSTIIEPHFCSVLRFVTHYAITRFALKSFVTSITACFVQSPT